MDVFQVHSGTERPPVCGGTLTVHVRCDGRYGFIGILGSRVMEISLDERSFHTVVEARNAAMRWAVAHGADRVLLIEPDNDIRKPRS